MAFKNRLKIIDDLKVTSPCPDEKFTENADRKEQGWFCHLCTKNVYDLQAMSKKEIAQLLKKTNGNFCGVISRRADGSMITREPVGAAAAMLSAGVLLASTTLLAPQAFAQSERGDVAAPIPPPPVYQAAGGISVRPTPTPQPTATPTQNNSENENSEEHIKEVVAPTPHALERGKVAVRQSD